MRLDQIRGFDVVALAASFLTAAVFAATPACSDSAERECHVGADCASGVCGADGLCAAPDGSDGGPDGGGGATDGGAGSDGAAADASTDAKLPGCTPNKDGTITRDEVPIIAGLHATYKIGQNEDVSTAGTPIAGGMRSWDYSGALASDVGVLVETQPLTGKWFESKYPGATYASKLSESTDVLGVFETSPGALLLRGVVSPTDSSSASEITYTPAVAVLKFPLSVGATWTTDATASGRAKGYDIATYAPTTEKYESKVDAAGELKTPLGTFDVLRVAVVLTRKVGWVPVTTTVRTFAFVTECYGTIATVTSTDNEANAEFTRAAEIRRLSP